VVDLAKKQATHSSGFMMQFTLLAGGGGWHAESPNAPALAEQLHKSGERHVAPILEQLAQEGRRIWQRSLDKQ
jgi:hypothetical protein